MIDAIATYLSELRRRKDIVHYNEAETKQSVILYILNLLGWNPFDTEEVKPEYSVGNRRVDYALRLHGIPKVFIEVKRIDENLSQHEEQLVTYATTESVKLATLTNGITWWLYLPLVEGKWEQKKFYTIDILEQEPAYAADKFVQFLSKPMTVTGESTTKAEAVFKGRQKDRIISTTLPVAWNRLVEEADDILVQLLKETTEKLCGYEIETEAVIKFLEQHQDGLLLGTSSRYSPTVSPISPRPSIPKPHDELLEDSFQRSQETTLRVVINWEKVGKSQPAELIENDRGIRIFIRALERIAKQVGMTRFEELLNFPVSRGMLLSQQRTKYHRKPLLGYFVLTYNATDEKAKILGDVVDKFNLPPDFLKVEIVDWNH